jgi:hypothetical protein
MNSKQAWEMARTPDPEILAVLAALAEIEVPQDDLGKLADSFGNVLAGCRVLRSLDLSAVEPVVTFDPAWD